ncbi:hypothetical protein COY87_05825 [Candidatus Roizmanbacteria bacterium CG_4_10_14_0_8_um_filter_33_9]|uniref:Glycosyltransferase RgtA/B/C/D-like domain-containing protein n=1 Tax=Candidatus Roizmanbacteria bacterium CG_4_10_14_0_8_um_filter_33_9 TaxID=1974826 RepID=A0A2M7QGP9_9BACT|nr:MAG: hypothetical protein COY87_05825 [Candidatus Roizmanbacteria bacterium CG_4_10_14_0_8_um_filter_33_9]
MFKKISLIVGIVIILFFWKETILHIGTQSHDWYDGSFIIWSIQTNINHFKNLQFDKLYETNAMYPFAQSLSFTDHLYIPSLIALFISFFSSNPIFQFNVLWILNHITVFLTFYLLTGRFSKNHWARIITAFYTSFGPYFFLQFGHLQMVFLWPLFLSLYFLLDPCKKKKSMILSGVFLGVQFLTGTYLGILGLTMVGLYYVSQLILLFCSRDYKHKRNHSMDSCLPLQGKRGNDIVHLLKEFSIIFVSFLIISSPSIYGYLLLNQTYHPQRPQSEFVTYSAHITDYLFPLPPRSTFLYQKLSFWTNLNKHYLGEHASFVGLVPLGIIIFVILNLFQDLKKRKMLKKFQHDNMSSMLNKQSILSGRLLFIWIGLLAIFGFIFSLGPRMNWNGTYLVTPLPYWLVMKLFPPIAIMRAVARWYFLVVFATSIIMIIGIDSLMLRFKKFSSIIIGALLVLLFLEFYSLPLSVSSKNWKSDSYLFLQKLCKQNPKPILEYPFEYRDKATDIGKYLSLKTNSLMSSTLHNCPTLSGFSSFEPPLFKKWQEDFDTNGITNTNLKILKENKFGFVKINLDALSKEEKLNPQSVIHTTDLKELFRDLNSIIYEIIN